MSRQSPVITIQEIPGNKFPDLAAAQQLAKKATASELTEILRSLLDSGVLVQVDGRIIPAKLKKG